MTKTRDHLQGRAKVSRNVHRKKDTELSDAELGNVTGGLQNAFSNVIKSIGQGLQTMASKQ